MSSHIDHILDKLEKAENPFQTVSTCVNFSKKSNWVSSPQTYGIELEKIRPNNSKLFGKASLPHLSEHISHKQLEDKSYFAKMNLSIILCILRIYI